MRRWIDERGSSGISFLSLFPLFIALIFLLVQAGMYYQATSVAQSAAQAGYHAARLADADTSKASSAAHQILAQHPGALRDASVAVSQSPGGLTVTVSGSSQSLVGQWIMPAVSKSVNGPLERVVIR